MISVLIFADYYLPGEKAGGPIRSLSNLVEALGDEFAFKIVTRHYDLGSRKPYTTVPAGQWLTVGKAQVLYLSRKELTPWRIRRIMLEISHDVLYLNSMFSPVFSILPVTLRRWGIVPQAPVLIAPRGEFARGAMALSALKKRLYLFVSRRARVYDQPELRWHASTELEAQDIRRVLASGRTDTEVETIEIASNVLGQKQPPIVKAMDVARLATVGDIRQGPKVPRMLRATFLSRIAPNKNLLLVVRALRLVSGTVSFSIYGPIEDQAYWKRCAAAIAELPDNVRVHYRGHVDHEQVVNTLSQYHVFVFPTLGENFGHVIAEALFAGCPVITTSDAPWAEIANRRAGTVLTKPTVDELACSIQQYVDMDETAFRPIARAAAALGRATVTSPASIIQNREMLAMAAASMRLVAERAG